MTASGQIPAHVPRHLVRDYNWTDMGAETDAFRHVSKLHDGPDIFYTPYGDGHWVVTRYEDMDYIFTHPEAFSSRHCTLPKVPFTLPLIEFDGQLHADFRNALAPFFTPKSIGNLEQLARELTLSLMDGFYAKGECEFIEDFAKRMPIIIIMRLLGLPPEDTPYLLPLAEDVVRSGERKRQEESVGKIREYIVTKVLPARRAKLGHDIFSALVQARVDGGRPITDDEISAQGCQLIAAGLDTVASMLGFVALFLAENPDNRQQLIDDPGLINDALEQIMRRHSLPNMARVVVEDMEYKGIAFKAGDLVLTPNSASGIDPRRYPDPFKVDFKSKDKKHLAFGRGPHQCLGAFLARTELRVFLQEWLKRIPHFQVKPGVTPVSVCGKASGLLSLPLIWPVS